ncbi:hypothetical protein [Streptomyces beijiangensis]|uniref:Lipoprotein n=1 Tax=Streptomyces beijiangensis TaxID=163361 RepID=A0A939JEV3_9ACTN|nr:hypothetical protein [Streptomyces beijiangensis]MBO0513466.1 hypothetical protein [Streptomyces beijiangensis]
MRRLVRTTALTAVATAAALALAGCSSSDKDTSDNGSATAAASKSPAPTGDSGSSTGGGSGKSADIDGTWVAQTDGKTIALSVSGKIAAIAGEHVCTGTVADMGKQMLTLKCADGNTDRTMGAVESADGKTLVVSWDAGIKDTFTKPGDMKLPSGITLPKT